MSASQYNHDMTLYPANQFQPDCCSSLVYSWFGAMKSGETAGEEWCDRAHRERENSAFYANHIERNGLINGVTETENVGRANKVASILGKVAVGTENREMAVAARNILVAIDDPIKALLSRKPERDARRILNFRYVDSWSNNVEDHLYQSLRLTAPGMRFYLLSVSGSEGKGHVIGIISTKSEGFFSNNGYLYYYDPNLNRVVRWRSREDLILFIKRVKSDYKGFRKLTQLAIPAIN